MYYITEIFPDHFRLIDKLKLWLESQGRLDVICYYISISIC